MLSNLFSVGKFGIVCSSLLAGMRSRGCVRGVWVSRYIPSVMIIRHHMYHMAGQFDTMPESLVAARTKLVLITLHHSQGLRGRHQKSL